MSNIEFETPATRVIKQFSGKDDEQFRIPADLPDITFLRALSIQGRLTYNVVTNTGDPLVITPADGTTFFVYQIVLTNISTTNINTFTITNNGNVRLVIRINARISVEGVVANPSLIIPFFDSLVGNGIKTFEIAGDRTEDITVLGWNENTSRIRDVTI